MSYTRVFTRNDPLFNALGNTAILPPHPMLVEANARQRDPIRLAKVLGLRMRLAAHRRAVLAVVSTQSHSGPIYLTQGRMQRNYMGTAHANTARLIHGNSFLAATRTASGYQAARSALRNAGALTRVLLRGIREGDVTEEADIMESYKSITRSVENTCSFSMYTGVKVSLAAVISAAAQGEGIDIHACEHCNALVGVDGSRVETANGEEFWCPSCVDDDAIYSEFMGVDIDRADAINIYNSVRAARIGDPSDYATHAWLNRHEGDKVWYADGKWFEDYDAYCEMLDATAEDEETDDDGVPEYHSSKNKVGHIPSEFDKRTPRLLLGLELEFEVDGDRSDAYRDVLRRMQWAAGRNHRYAWLEQDGSLEDGFEMVTGFTGLDVHAAALPDDFTGVHEGLRSHDTETCGLHVHIDRAGMTVLHAAKLMHFINADENNPFIIALARREGSSYATKQTPDQVKRGVQIAVRNMRSSRSSGHPRDSQVRTGLRSITSGSDAHHKYNRLNFGPEKTVEFRLFRGTTRKRTIMASLEFTYLSWHFTHQMGLRDMTVPKFMAFIYSAPWRKDSKHLRAYLSDKGYRDPSALAIEVKREAAVTDNPADTHEDIVVDEVPDLFTGVEAVAHHIEPTVAVQRAAAFTNAAFALAS